MRTREPLLFLSLVLAAAGPLPAEEGSFDKTISFPRGGEVKLDWSYGKCVITTLRVRNYPDRLEIEKARREDPNDRASISWEFAIDNRSSEKFSVKVVVEILDKSSQVVKSGEGGSKVGAHEADTVKVSTRVRTVEAADAPNVRLRAAIVPR
jgi:hypothetical protein